MQSSIFLLKEFDDWEAITPKTYPTLKTFIAVAYTQCLLYKQLRNTAGRMGYMPQTQNMYAVLEIRAQRGCTKHSLRGFDGVGRRRP
jgi:hypothetical protein